MSSLPVLLLLVIVLAMHATCSAMALRTKFTRAEVLKPFVEGKALKVISGLKNFDAASVKNVVYSASVGGASHVDIACDPSLVQLVRAATSGNIPVCVSSIDPLSFISAVHAGADMVEIGNFDGFYDQGIKFTADDVLKMTRETRELLPTIPLSVTIPHTLKLEQQISLAQRLEALGVDIIQTEGKMSVNTSSLGVQELIEVAAPTIASAYALSRAVNIPVMCASGITDITAPLALAAGARGVGVGSMVNKLPTQQQMILAVSAIAAAMGRNVDDVAMPEVEVEPVAAKQSISSRLFRF